MAIAINGDGTITGVSVGGLPDGCVANDDLAGSIVDGKITGLAASKLTGALPAISGASLTGLPTGSAVSHVAVHQDNGTTQNNVTGDGTTYDILWQTEITDTGNEYASSVFTATSAGKYLIAWHVATTGWASNNDEFMHWCVTSNLTKKCLRYDGWAISGAGGGVTSQLTMGYANVFHLDAADTAKVQIQVSGGSKVVDVQVDTQSANYLTITKLS